MIDAGWLSIGPHRRAELLRRIGLNKVASLFTSTSAAMDRAASTGRAGAVRRHGIHFLSHHPAPARRPANLHVVPSLDWPGGDLIASSDAVLAKAGYGTVCEAMAAGTPMIYPPATRVRGISLTRPRLASWSGGVPISSRDFRKFKLERALNAPCNRSPVPLRSRRTEQQELPPPDGAVPPPRGQKVWDVAF